MSDFDAVSVGRRVLGEEAHALGLMAADLGEEFLATYRRLGPKPFKEALYATA